MREGWILNAEVDGTAFLIIFFLFNAQRRSITNRQTRFILISTTFPSVGSWKSFPFTDTITPLGFQKISNLRKLNLHRRTHFLGNNKWRPPPKKKPFKPDPDPGEGNTMDRGHKPTR